MKTINHSGLITNPSDVKQFLLACIEEMGPQLVGPPYSLLAAKNVKPEQKKHYDNLIQEAQTVAEDFDMNLDLLTDLYLLPLREAKRIGVKYEAAEFWLDGMDEEETISGYHNPGYDWNGWKAPMFEREEALTFLHYGGWDYCLGDDHLLVRRDDEDEIQRIPLQPILVNGKVKMVYNMGLNCCWEVVK